MQGTRTVEKVVDTFQLERPVWGGCPAKGRAGQERGREPGASPGSEPWAMGQGTRVCLTEAASWVSARTGRGAQRSETQAQEAPVASTAQM